VIIRLSTVEAFTLLDEIDGRVTVPRAVEREVESEPAASHLKAASDTEDGWVRVLDPPDLGELGRAATHLGSDEPPAEPPGERRSDQSSESHVEGDVELLAHAMSSTRETVVVTDDQPLRETCKALSVPVSGSIGVLIRAVECGAMDGDAARDRLYAMDEVGARLSASLIRRAERMIDDADG
jgi:predicted nucleic acid-binding protein